MQRVYEFGKINLRNLHKQVCKSQVQVQVANPVRFFQRWKIAHMH